MGYFDPEPKSEKGDLFDREKELEEMVKLLKLRERLIIVYGIRRIGKTSIVNVALRESGLPFLIVDVRGVYFESGTVTPISLIKSITDAFKKNLKLYGKLGFEIKDLWGKLQGFTFLGLGIEKKSEEKSLSDLFSMINEWSEKHKTIFIIVFDEAQYFRFSQIKIREMLAWIADNLLNVKVILTGSEVGVLRELLRVDDPSSAIYGRLKAEVNIERFSKKVSMEFLKKGFEQIRVKVDEREIEEAVRRLDGIVGWLTYYGYYRGINKKKHEDALNLVFKEGANVVISELERVIAPSRLRYLTILKAVAEGINRWSEIKDYVMMKTRGRITNAKLTELLNNLIKYGYLEKKGRGIYKIPDPIVKYAIKMLK